MYLLLDDTHWESAISEGVLCCSAKSLRYLFVTGPHILQQNYRKSLAEDILHSRRLELSSHNLDFDPNIFYEALFELNKEVESLSGKSIKDFGFTLSLKFNLNATINAEYIRETNYNHSRLLQIIQDEHSLNPEKKKFMT